MTNWVFFLFLFAILLENYVAFCREKHSPKPNDREHRNNQRHSKPNDGHHKNVKRHDEHHKSDNKQSKKQHVEEQKELSLQNCDQLGRHYFSHCYEMSFKNGQCPANELPMRIKDCVHLKKFINTNLHTLVEEPTGGTHESDNNHPHHGAVHGEHVGAFVTAKNVMCCSVEMENSLHHAIQMINNRLMLAHELALYRFAHQIPVDDPEREATALKHVGNQANAAGIDAEFAVNFLLAQMEANKMIQNGYIDRWNSDHLFESKYVPDLEKEILPKISYATNALILALIPLISAGHQLYNDQNCVDHVENALESMDHLRASEMEPNGKLAMEKAVRGICDKVSTHEEDLSQNSKKRKLSPDHRHGVEKKNHKNAHNQMINSTKRSNKLSKIESNPVENKTKSRVHSPTNKEKLQKTSPKRREIEDKEVKKMDDKKMKTKNNERNDNSKKIAQKSPRRIEVVSDRSIMIKPGDDIQELSHENINEEDRSREKKRANKESEMKNIAADKVKSTKKSPMKSPKKSPRRIEISDRSVLIKMDDIISAERQDTQKSENKTQKNNSLSGEESREQSLTKHNSESEEKESDAYSNREIKKKTLSPFKKRTKIEKNHSVDQDELEDDKSFEGRKDSVFENHRKISSLEKSGEKIVAPTRNNTAQEKQRKDSLTIYRSRRLMDGESNETSKNRDISVLRDNSMDEANHSKNQSASIEKSVKAKERVTSAEIRAEDYYLNKPKKEDKSAEDSIGNRGITAAIKSGQITNRGKEQQSGEFHHIELEPDAESIVIHTGAEKPVKIKLRRKTAKRNEVEVMEENVGKGSGIHPELETPKENEELSMEINDQQEDNSADVGEPGGEKLSKFKIMKAVSSVSQEKDDATKTEQILDEKSEEQSNKKSGISPKNKFKMKKIVSSEEKNGTDKKVVKNSAKNSDEKMEKRSGESLRKSPKNKFKVQRVGSEESKQNEKVQKNDKDFDEKMEKRSGENLRKSPKNKFKIQRVVSEEQNGAHKAHEDRSEEELSKSPPIDKSNEYVMAPEKISAEFGEKSDEKSRGNDKK